MNSTVFIVIILQICAVYSQTNSDSTEKSSNSLQLELINSNSIINELVNNVSDIGFLSDRCKKELLLIKEGIKKRDVWAFKSECQVKFTN